MTIKRIDILNHFDRDESGKMDDLLNAGWKLLAHSTFVIEDDIYDRFWLQSPKPQMAAKPQPVPMTSAHEVACAAQEDMLKELVRVVNTGNFVVLDTETNGLDDDAEIVEIAIIDHDGQILVNSLVAPNNQVRDVGTRWHGISASEIVQGLTWPYLEPLVHDALAGKVALIYNAEFDYRLIHQTQRAWARPYGDYKLIDYPRVCVMEAFAAHYGEFTDGKLGYKWQKLSTAAGFYSIPQTKSHRALADCQTTLALVRAMVNDLQ